MKIDYYEMSKMRKVFIYVLAIIVVILPLVVNSNAYSYSVTASIKYTVCSGHQNGIHYTFNKGTVTANNCKGVVYTDNDPSVKRKAETSIELRRRTLVGGIGYKSFGEKTIGTVTEGAGWKDLANASWKVDEKNSTYYTVVYMSANNISKKFKCTLSQ